MSIDQTSLPIPVVKLLDEIYNADTLPAQERRWAHLKHSFRTLYDKEPDFVARSPGRVNIIGEHIDYSLYDVLPMAIAADVLVAVSMAHSAGPATISIADVDGQKFAPQKFTLSTDHMIDIDASTHEWTNYFKAGLRGAWDHMINTQTSFSPPLSMSVLVDGNVPAGGGLSSSAALVCASALAVLFAHNPSLPISKRNLVELAIVSERLVGVNSGGMDQAASVFSICGDALNVSFSPNLQAKAIAFPKTNPPFTFMIAQSFVAADKHVTAPECYNLRVVECTLAAKCIAASMDLMLEKDSSPLGHSLRGLQNSFLASQLAKDRSRPVTKKAINQEQNELTGLKQMTHLVENHLPEIAGYTREAVATILGITLEELEHRYLTAFPVRTERFRLQQRALHVFSEAERVIEFRNKISPKGGLLSPETDSQEQETNSSDENLLLQLGALMTETQNSCRELYECSCPEIDSLCKIAVEAGAYGSRLTGAGWGGCTVHLVAKNKVDDVKGAWIKDYYQIKWPENFSGEGKVKEEYEEWLQEAMVVSEPGNGSAM